MGAGAAPRVGTAAWNAARLAWRDRATVSARALIARRSAPPARVESLAPGEHLAPNHRPGFAEPWPPGSPVSVLRSRHIIDGACHLGDCALLANAAAASLGVLRQRDGEASVAALGDVAADVIGEDAHAAARRLVREMAGAASAVARERLFPAGGLLTHIVPGDVPGDGAHGYWSAHVDKANVPEYDVSAVLYLSDGDGAHFRGGELWFLDGDGDEDWDGDEDGDGDGDGDGSALVTRRELIPARGRLVVFGSGEENVHAVRPVVEGQRATLNVWLTRDARAASDAHA